MNKKAIIGSLIGAAIALSPLAAFAATVSSQAIFDGQTQVYGNAGSNVQATFQVDVPAGQVLHAIRTKVDSQPTVCTQVGPVEGAQTTDVSTNITLPPNSNNAGYSLVADLYYTDTLPQAEAMTGDLACTSSVGGSHVNLAAYNGGTVVNVLPSSNGSNTSVPTSGSTGDDFWSKLAGIFAAALKANAPAPAPTPVVAQTCIDLAQYSALGQGSTGQAVSQLQGYLIYKGASIPAIAAGASYGFFGQQTAAALMSVKAQNHC